MGKPFSSLRLARFVQYPYKIIQLSLHDGFVNIVVSSMHGVSWIMILPSFWFCFRACFRENCGEQNGGSDYTRQQHINHFDARWQTGRKACTDIGSWK